jgi:DNA polymerase V
MRHSIFALVDCNNFFVSCERVFRPDLENRPVVVLSSNDGCAIARSNEAKALGIPMGAPAFKYRETFERHSVAQFSANFELYGNLARRITNILSSVTPNIEVYSIDESFLDISSVAITDYEAWGRVVRARILQEVGVPVSIGVAPTKTLAKLASEIAKQQPSHEGALYLTPEKPDFYPHLERMPVEEVWGVGWRLRPRLRAEGIATVGQLAQLRPPRAGQLMGVHGRQMVAELNGTSCIPLAPVKQVRKSIMRGRTFGEDTNESYVIESAIATLTAQAMFRVRSEALAVRRAGFMLETNRHKPGYRRWYREIKFLSPVQDTGQVIAALYAAFSDLYNRQQRYHRLNMYLYEFTPAHELQTDVFNHINLAAHARTTNRMQAIDTINNRFGRGHIHYAAEDLSRSWRPRRRLQSPHYVSNWDELPTAKIVE